MVGDSYKALEHLVSEIKAGDRVVLFPPGTMLFVIANLLLLLSFVLLTATLASVGLKDAEVSQQAITQLALIVLGGIILIPPAILLTRGKLLMRLWLLGVGGGVALIAAVVGVLGALSIFPEYWEYRLPLSFAFLGGGISVLICRSVNYRLFCYFFYLLRKKSTDN